VIAADAAGHPDPQALRDAGYLFVGKYVGTAHQAYGVSRAYIDECLAVGIGVLLIFEEWGNQFLGGYEAALASCDRMMRGWDALGAPRDGTVLPAVALLDPSPSAVYGNESQFRDYARGWNDALPFPEFTGYGSLYAHMLAADVAPKMTRRWGVGTWGYGEGRHGELPDAIAFSVEMIQHGNVASPVPNTDHNTLYRADMGQWGGPAPRPKPKDSLMWVAIIKGLDGLVHAYVCAGATILYELPQQPVSIFNIPQAAIDSGLHIERVDDKVGPDGRTAWDRLLTASDASLVLPKAAPVPG
jgi:hypothetical protein